MGLPLFLVDIGEAQSFTLSLVFVFDKRYEATFGLLFLFPFEKKRGRGLFYIKLPLFSLLVQVGVANVRGGLLYCK